MQIPGKGQRKPAVAEGSPHVILSLVVFVWVVCSFFSVRVALRQPWLGASFSASADSTTGLVAIKIAPSGPAAGIISPGDILLRIEDAGGASIALDQEMVIVDPDMLPGIRSWSRLRSRLMVVNRILKGPEVYFKKGDNRIVRVDPAAARPLSSLPIDLFGMLLFSIIALLIVFGIWIRSRDSLPVRLLMLSGAGVSIAAFASSVYSTRELALGLGLFRFLAALNHVGVYAFAVGVVGLLWHYPRRIAAFPMARMAGVIITCFWINEQFGWVEMPLHTYAFPIAVFFVVSLTFGAIQWFMARGRPTDRAALKWMLFSVLFIIGITMVVYFVPSVMGHVPLIPVSWTYAVLLLMYLGFAFSVFRYRLFDIERWWFNVWLWFFAGVSIIILDMLIAMILPGVGTYSLALSLALVGWGYFPVRQWLWRYVFRKSDLSLEAFLPMLIHAFMEHWRDKDSRWWGDILNEIFRPAHAAVISGPYLVELRDAGERLYVPLPYRDRGLELCYADHGSRLFTPADKGLAEALLRITLRMVGHLRAYSRGAGEERRRIMRDLHDEVGGQILNVLHQCRDDNLRQTAAMAMSSLREVIYSLDDSDPVDLDLAISRWRLLARERCDDAGMDLNWRNQVEGANIVLDNRLYYNLNLVFKEVLTNALKHGNGIITVRINLEEGNLHLLVGNPVERKGPESIHGKGLNNIRSRIAEVEGKVKIRAGATDFTVNWQVPLTGPGRLDSMGGDDAFNSYR